MWAPLLAVQMGDVYRFRYVLSLLANMVGAQGLRISRVVTKQDFPIAKIVIKYPPPKAENKK